jgi:sRNA-binding protein
MRTNKRPGAGGSAAGAEARASTLRGVKLKLEASLGPPPATSTELTEADLRARWPRAFNDLRRPLKIGIHEDMGRSDCDQAISLWCNHPTYLPNLIAGGARVDLDGRPAVAGTVAKTEQERALRALIYVRYDLSTRQRPWDPRRRYHRPPHEHTPPPRGLTTEEALAEIGHALPRLPKPLKSEAVP